MADINDHMNDIMKATVDSATTQAYLKVLDRIATALDGINTKLESVIAKRERSEGGNTKRWSVVRTDNRE
jgi:hypothetical protein